MSNAPYIRFHEAWDKATSGTRDLLRDLLQEADLEELAEPDAIRSRLDSIPEEARQTLEALVYGFPFTLSGDPIVSDNVVPLIRSALAFQIETGDESKELAIPFEVRLALVDEEDLTAAELGIHLALQKMDDLEFLGKRLGIDVDPDEPLIDAVLSIVEVLRDPDRLEEIFVSLPGAAQHLAHHLCEHPDPISLEKAAQLTAHYAELRDEEPVAADRILRGFGLVVQLEVEGDTLLVMPLDLREMLREIIRESLLANCEKRYNTLRSRALPAPRDIFPHGAGGNPLTAARQMLAGQAPVIPGFATPLENFLRFFHILGDSREEMPYTSLTLDVATPDAFAQRLIRIWLESFDDFCTQALVGVFGGDSKTLSTYLMETMEFQDPTETRWFSFINKFRSLLTFGLGMLGPGMWYPVRSLPPLVSSLYQLCAFDARGFQDVPEDAWGHALPIRSYEVSSQETAKLYEAILITLHEFFEPIGAVQLDQDATHFMVNSEALRVFRDGEQFFDEIWHLAESIYGDDVDLWVPFPNSWGARVTGVALMDWVAPDVLRVGPTAHCHDLSRLSQWASALSHPTEFLFRFDRDHIHSSAEAREFIAWLIVRTGEMLPPEVQATFVPSLSAMTVVEATEFAEGRVRELREEMREWAHFTPRPLAEEVRSWGPVVANELSAGLLELVDSGNGDDPHGLHLALILGEVNAREAVPALFRAFSTIAQEQLEAAAGIALARIGGPAAELLLGLLADPIADLDKRVAAASALSSLCVMHPASTPAFEEAVNMVIGAAEDLPEDVPTLLALMLAETGSPSAEALITSLRDQGFWLEEILPVNEALWISGIAPSIWGHPIVGTPFAQLFPDEENAIQMRDSWLEDEDEESEDENPEFGD